MIEVEEATMDGKTVIRLIPETEADRREIDRRARAGEIQVGGSFADDEDQDDLDEMLGFE
jgi:hypothetical protein